MKKHLISTLALILACALLLPAAPVQATRTGFPDVPGGCWYEQSLLILQNYLPGIIDGMVDADGVKRFHPDDNVTRGQFLRMAMTAGEAWTTDHSRDDIHWAGKYYTMAMENNVLMAAMTSEDEGAQPDLLLFPCTKKALDQEISRYEMAVILNSVCQNMLHENMLVTTKAYQYISDYNAISARYVASVEQSFGKGLLTGYEDGSFQGDNSLRRSEAAVVIYRLATGIRKTADWASSPRIDPIRGSSRPRDFVSFAEWLYDGHVDAYSNPTAEARLRLFGDKNKTYFATIDEAAPYITGVLVPIWYIDGKTGNKATKNVLLVVNKVVEEEIKLIFQQIYNDPERFPIESVGAARFTGETGRHAWGCAVDINPYYNCECNFHSGSCVLTCGSGWWPEDMEGETWVGRDISAYHGKLTGPSVYSISPNGSVVRAFADYGWGWGGSGTNEVGKATGWSKGKNFDFMHFSVWRDGG